MYPHLSGPAAREALEQDRNADDQFEIRDAARIESKAFGLKKAIHRAKAEGRRVANLIAQDRADRAEDTLRKEAEIEFDDGKLVAMRDVAIGPTPEQIAQAERGGVGFTKFTPRLPDGSVATVSAYRRRDLPQAHKMLFAGVIDHKGLAACLWYRNLHEMTGLAGNIASIDYGREVFAAPQGRTMFTDWQVEAQDTFRFVRRNIRSRHLALLDLMVLQDVPIHRATRAARAFHRRAKEAFGEAVKQLLDARDAAGGS